VQLKRIILAVNGETAGGKKRADLNSSRSALCYVLVNVRFYAVFSEQQPPDVSFAWLVPQHAGFSSTTASTGSLPQFVPTAFSPHLHIL
jgi:hypothetical protein